MWESSRFWDTSFHTLYCIALFTSTYTYMCSCISCIKPAGNTRRHSLAFGVCYFALVAIRHMCTHIGTNGSSMRRCSRIHACSLSILYMHSTHTRYSWRLHAHYSWYLTYAFIHQFIHTHSCMPLGMIVRCNHVLIHTQC